MLYQRVPVSHAASPRLRPAIVSLCATAVSVASQPSASEREFRVAEWKNRRMPPGSPGTHLPVAIVPPRGFQRFGKVESSYISTGYS